MVFLVGLAGIFHGTHPMTRLSPEDVPEALAFLYTMIELVHYYQQLGCRTLDGLRGGECRDNLNTSPSAPNLEPRMTGSRIRGFGMDRIGQTTAQDAEVLIVLDKLDRGLLKCLRYRSGVVWG
jgi:hypothetical protein